MKSKFSNKFNILFGAMIILLIFVATFMAVGRTNSWLTDTHDIGFIVNVTDINIDVKQGEREVIDGGMVYLNTEFINAGVEYLGADDGSDHVTITNNEPGVGYYIRFKAIAVVNGVSNDINQYLTSDFKNIDDDGWLYSVRTGTTTKRAMAQNETLKLIESITFDNEFIEANQGKLIRLHLYIEGSPTVDFAVSE